MSEPDQHDRTEDEEQSDSHRGYEHSEGDHVL